MNKKVWIDCECGSEGIMLLKDDGMVELSFFQYGHVGKLSWRQRLHFCWRILWRGTPYTDMVILSKEEVEKLQTTLKELTDD